MADLQRMWSRGLEVVMALVVGCGTTATPLRPGDFPIEGQPNDARPDPVIPRAPMVREGLQDQAIEAAIRRGLGVESDALAATVDVAVNDGWVRLSGATPSARHRRIAEVTARAVAGVRGVTNELRLEPVLRDDEAVAEDVREALADIAGLWQGIVVKVNSGIVELTGTVRSAGARRLVEQRVAAVAGVRDVSNRLRSASEQSFGSDAELRARLEQTLRGYAGGSVEDVSFAVKDGIVSLSGRVPSFELRRSLIERAWIAGARGLDEQRLLVAWGTATHGSERASPRSAAEISAAVAEAFAADPLLVDLELGVEVEGTTAILRGAVPTLDAKQTAAKAAGAVPGIARVDNRIEVSHHAVSDEELAVRVVRAFTRDAYLDHKTIRVRVQDHRVHLVGSVDATFERERATVLAGRVAGVREVINALEVKKRLAGSRR